ncbi:MAG: elongation factor P 5-aminopentanone reductase [Bacillus sp. (in: firmicutes)]
MEKKFVLLTGASGAIGKATAVMLAKQGYSLYLHYNQNKQAIRDLINQLEPYEIDILPICADLSTVEGVDQLCSQIFSLHSIVFISGKAHYGLVTDVSPEEMQEMIHLHLTSPFMIVQKLLSKLKGKRLASIVAVTSIWGDTGASYEVLYSMLKGGQNAYVKALSKELAPMGIRVNAVSPGIVDTPMVADFTEEEKREIVNEIPLGRLAQPEEIANSIVYLLSEQASYITGHVLKVNGGWYV